MRNRLLMASALALSTVVFLSDADTAQAQFGYGVANVGGIGCRPTYSYRPAVVPYSVSRLPYSAYRRAYVGPGLSVTRTRSFGVPVVPGYPLGYRSYRYSYAPYVVPRIPPRTRLSIGF